MKIELPYFLVEVKKISVNIVITNIIVLILAILQAIKPTTDPVIEQIGSYDPLPNKYNEKLVAINFQRLNYWIKEGAIVSKSVKKLLGK